MIPESLLIWAKYTTTSSEYGSIPETTSATRIVHFDVHLWRIGTVHFLSKDGKGASYEERDGWKRCLFPAKVGILTFGIILLDSNFPYL